MPNPRTAEQQGILDEMRRHDEKYFGKSIGGVADQMSGKMGDRFDLANGPQTVEGFDGGSWDDTVNRYRGGAMRKEAPIALDQRQADETRGMQMGALRNLSLAARGGAPSQAGIQGRAAIGDATRAGTMQATAARGPGNQISAMRTGMASTGDQQAALMNRSLAGSGKELTTDMGALGSIARGVRGQDVAAATSNAQLEAQRRAMEEQNRQNYERMAYDTRRVQAGTGRETAQQFQAAKQAVADDNHANEQREQGNLATGVGTFGTVATGGMGAAAKVAAKQKK